MNPEPTHGADAKAAIEAATVHKNEYRCYTSLGDGPFEQVYRAQDVMADFILANCDRLHLLAAPAPQARARTAGAIKLPVHIERFHREDNGDENWMVLSGNLVICECVLEGAAQAIADLINAPAAPAAEPFAEGSGDWLPFHPLRNEVAPDARYFIVEEDELEEATIKWGRHCLRTDRIWCDAAGLPHPVPMPPVAPGETTEPKGNDDAR